MLERTLDIDTTPGTNVAGDFSETNWVFLLPTLGLARVVCLGVPPTRTLTALHGLAGHVVVIVPPSPAPPPTAVSAGVDVIVGSPDRSLPVRAGSADLVVVTGQLTPRQRRDVHEVTVPGGSIWFDVESSSSAAEQPVPARALVLAPFSQRRPPAPSPDPREPVCCWVPASSRRRSPLEQAYGKGVRALQRGVNRSARLLGGQGRMTTRDPSARVGSDLQFLVAPSPATRRPDRHGSLLLPPGAALDLGPPGWLRRLAAGAELDLDGWRWGMGRSTEYESQKLLLFLFQPGQPRPALVVKATRSRRFNDRLQAEISALRALEAADVVDLDTVPRVRFSGRPGGLVVCAETAVQGVPFRQRSSGAPDCPLALSAVDWLLGLGSATADRCSLGPTQAAARLALLVDRFCEVYDAAPEVSSFLGEQLAEVGSAETFPVVFAHGDPGNWNLLVTHSGKVAFLDWENAEPLGVPLWDLLYFIQTYGVWAASVAGMRYGPRVFTRQLLLDSPFHRLLVATAGRYCAVTGLPPRLVSPLFHLFLVQQAVREGLRLPPAGLSRGRYVQLLHQCIRHPAALAGVGHEDLGTR